MKATSDQLIWLIKRESMRVYCVAMRGFAVEEGEEVV